MAMSVHEENMRELSARLETQDAKVAKCEHDLNQAIAARESGEILNALRSLYEGASRERQGLINERVALINERAMKKQEVTYSSAMASLLSFFSQPSPISLTKKVSAKPTCHGAGLERLARSDVDGQQLLDLSLNTGAGVRKRLRQPEEAPQ